MSSAASSTPSQSTELTIAKSSEITASDAIIDPNSLFNPKHFAVSVAFKTLTDSLAYLATSSAKEFIEFSLSSENVAYVNSTINRAQELGYEALALASETNAIAETMLEVITEPTVGMLRTLVAKKYPELVTNLCLVVTNLGQVQNILKGAGDSNINYAWFAVYKARLALLGLVVGAVLAVTVVALPVSVESTSLGLAGVVTIVKSVADVVKAIKDQRFLSVQADEIVTIAQDAHKHAQAVLDVANRALASGKVAVANLHGQSQEETDAVKNRLLEMIKDSNNLRESAKRLIDEATKMPRFDKKYMCTIL